VGFGAAVGKVVEEGTGGAAGIISTELLKYGTFKPLHQLPVWLFFFQPVQSQAQQRVEGFQIRIRLGGLFDGLGKVGGGKDAGIRFAQTGSGTGQASLAEMMERGSPGGFPADFAFVKKIEMAAHGAAGFGRSLGEGADDAMVPGQPDGQQAGLPLAAEMKQNPFILKRLAQVLSLAEGATREDKRDDSGKGKV